MTTRTPRASCTTILIARPIRLLLATIIFFCLVASLKWNPSAAVRHTVSGYFGHDDTPRTPAFPDRPGSATLSSEDEGDTDRRPNTDDRDGWSDSKPSGPPRGAMDMGEKSIAVAEDQKPHSIPPETSPYGFVFYATQDAFACSVLVNVDRLQNKFKTRFPIFVLVTESVTQPYIDALKSRNVVVSLQIIPPLAPTSNQANYGCLMKLLAFKMHHISSTLKRVLILEADQLILKNLDNLFDLPQVDLAAPRNYLVDKDMVSTNLMLVSPSDRLWSTIEPAMKNIGPARYDTDIVNDVLGETALLLPGSFIANNSHWESWGIPPWFKKDDTASSAASKTTSTSAAPAAASTPAKAAQPMQRLPAGKGIEVNQDDDGSPSAHKLVKRVVEEDDASYMMDGESHAPQNQAPKRPPSYLPPKVMAPAPSAPSDVLASVAQAQATAAAVAAPATGQGTDAANGTPSPAEQAKMERPNYQKLYEVYAAASVLHFASFGKPWSYSYAEVQVQSADAHPLFYEQFKEWRTTALEACPPGLIAAI